MSLGKWFRAAYVANECKDQSIQPRTVFSVLINNMDLDDHFSTSVGFIG